MPAVTSNAAGQQAWQQNMLNTYGTPRLTLVRGSGAQLWDADGGSYLDLLGGIAVNALGHAHPAVVAAVSEQVATLGHVANFYASPPALALAERLQQITGLPGARSMLCNSGAEANEIAFKIARRTGRPRIISTTGGFHGRTMGALALTGQPGKQQPFAPLPAGVEFVDYGDAEALEAAVDERTAAVFLEPIQGEAGVIEPPAEYLARAAAITRGHGALLVLDEVQTGIGRTGYWMAHHADGVVPDVITMAKGLGGGLPIGACLAHGRAAQLLEPGQHGTTFGGNPISCAAALAVLETIERQDLLAAVTERGNYLAAAVRAVVHPLLGGIRGRGLLRALLLTRPVAKQFALLAEQAGFLVNPVAADAVRLAPPLIIEEEQLASFASALPGLLQQTAAADETEWSL